MYANVLARCGEISQMAGKEVNVKVWMSPFFLHVSSLVQLPSLTLHHSDDGGPPHGEASAHGPIRPAE